MLEAEDEDGAKEFADGLLGPAAVSNDIGGTEVLVGEDGLSTVLYEGFLLLGTKAGIAGIVDTPAAAKTLDETAATSVLDRLPGGGPRLRLPIARGRRRADRGSRLPQTPSTPSWTPARRPASPPRSASTATTRILPIRSDLDPEESETSPGFFGALPKFKPSLTADVGGDSLAYLGLGDPSSSIDSLRLQAAAEAPALLAAFDRFEAALQRDGGISLEEDLLPLLGSEVALSVEPVFDESAPVTPGTVVSSGTPYLSLIAAGVDEKEAATALAGLQAPLIEALAPEDGAQVPAFEASDIAGVEAQSLFLSPQVDLTYATFADRLVIATNRLAVEEARAGDGGLAGTDGFVGLTADLPEEVSLLVYLNLDGLLGLGEQVGLAEDPVYATFAPDLRNLKAAALTVAGDDEAIDTDLRIATAAPQAVGVAAPPTGGE